MIILFVAALFSSDAHANTQDDFTAACSRMMGKMMVPPNAGSTVLDKVKIFCQCQSEQVKKANVPQAELISYTQFMAKGGLFPSKQQKIEFARISEAMQAGAKVCGITGKSAEPAPATAISP